MVGDFPWVKDDWIPPEHGRDAAGGAEMTTERSGWTPEQQAILRRASDMAKSRSGEMTDPNDPDKGLELRPEVVAKLGEPVQREDLLTADQMRDKLATEQSRAYLDRLAAATVEREGVWSHRDCLTLGHCDLVSIGTKVGTDCYGTGTLPRFPGVRRECNHRWKTTEDWYNQTSYGNFDCQDCDAKLENHQVVGGTGKVTDYDAKESAVMAGLTFEEYNLAEMRFRVIINKRNDPHAFVRTDPMPSQAEIREAWLKAVCRVAGLL